VAIYEVTIAFDGGLGRLSSRVSITRDVEGQNELAKVVAWCEEHNLAHVVWRKTAPSAEHVIRAFEDRIATYRKAVA
jgi:hypothetical protein